MTPTWATASRTTTSWLRSSALSWSTATLRTASVSTTPTCLSQTTWRTPSATPHSAAREPSWSCPTTTSSMSGPVTMSSPLFTTCWRPEARQWFWSWETYPSGSSTQTWDTTWRPTPPYTGQTDSSGTDWGKSRTEMMKMVNHHFNCRFYLPNVPSNLRHNSGRAVPVNYNTNYCHPIYEVPRYPVINTNNGQHNLTLSSHHHNIYEQGTLDSHLTAKIYWGGWQCDLYCDKSLSANYVNESPFSNLAPESDVDGKSIYNWIVIFFLRLRTGPTSLGCPNWCFCVPDA